MNKNKRFKVAVLAASIALAMSATSAMAAAPTATQLPGQGKVVSADGTITSSFDATEGTMAIGVTGAAVIDWGKGTDINKDGVGGFNIGSDASVTFNGQQTGSIGGTPPTPPYLDPITGDLISPGTPGTPGTPVYDDAVLNIDSSGNASQIFGTLTGNNTAVFVANANGIIVGADATVSGNVGLIANTLSSTAAADFTTTDAVEYAGTGGDVTVQAGADLSSVTLISGGGTVNVDASALNSAVILSAGLSSDTAGGFATDNDAAKLEVTGDGTVASFSSAGDASSNGTLTISAGDVAGTFTNTGTLTLADSIELSGALVNEKTVTTTGATGGGLTLGGLTNDGEFTASSGLTVNGDLVNNGQYIGGAISVADGNLTNGGAIGGDENAVDLTVDGGSLANKGMASVGAVSVTGGDLANDGTIGSNGSDLTAIDGNIVNNGEVLGFNQISTDSDDDFTAGADYSITNAGTMEMSSIDVNDGDRSDDNDTTGSFTNAGVLQLKPSDYNSSHLYITAHDDLNLGGSVQVRNADTGKYAAVSASNQLSDLGPTALNGTLTIATPLVFDGHGQVDGAYMYSSLYGQQIKLMADVIGTDYSADLTIYAGDKLADDYTIRIGSGVTVSASDVHVMGFPEGNHPNVIVQGTLAGEYVNIGGDDYRSDQGVSDFFTGPNGRILATGDNPFVMFNFTGRVKTAPYLNDGNNFRYNGLPITVTDADSVYLELNPAAYQTNGTSNGLSGVNLLVTGSVSLDQEYAELAVDATGTAVTGVTNLPNTHLVLQSTGNIDTNGSFYWPGYVYLGTIAANADGSAAPGTLGLGMISLDGNFNNVLPGDISGAGGVHFITQFPLGLDDGEGGTYEVVTNANSWVNFGTDLLTQGYATGTLGGSFYGGTQTNGTVVNYGELDPSMFHTHAPVATR